ncbi:MAG: LysR family transcriptional regulator, partial [Sneathiella sp.]
MDKLANMKAFTLVAQTGSFAEAARKLNLTKSVISKRVKDLEAYLGTALFHRTTRNVRLTDTGYGYLDYARKFLDELEEVEEAIRHRTDSPIGEIKLAAPLSFGIRYLGPALASYLHTYPEVSLRTFLSDRKIDLVSEGYDFAIRIGPLQDSSLISKKLITCRRVVCASPDYFAKFGRPAKPSDLANHNCMKYADTTESKSWPFVIDGKKKLQLVSGRFSSDNGDLLCEA